MEIEQWYDNLLYFYAYNYALIQNEYIWKEKEGKKFPRIEGYIHK